MSIHVNDHASQRGLTNAICLGRFNVVQHVSTELSDALGGLPLSCGMEALLRIKRRGCRGSRSRSARSARSEPATDAKALFFQTVALSTCVASPNKRIEQKTIEERPNFKNSCNQALKTCAGCFGAERWPIHHPLHGTFLTISEFQISDCEFVWRYRRCRHFVARDQTTSFSSCIPTRNNCSTCFVSIRLVTACSNLIVFQHSYQLPTTYRISTTSTSSPSRSRIIVFGVKIHWLPEAHCIGFGPFDELDSRSASLHFLPNKGTVRDFGHTWSLGKSFILVEIRDTGITKVTLLQNGNFCHPLFIPHSQKLHNPAAPQFLSVHHTQGGTQIQQLIAIITTVLRCCRHARDIRR